ncbi:hypothetical protein Pcinc_026688 [Petrolisthes cinctipes]|uniref:Uncharacterized protein n=1 Tax=Petrolisthes cinctipes TaxID=88211 RepID=A0AAE1K9Y5_PETCI|nr:hypothetical protein Pcinc_026688 [Petrolisthes cinctipes]
MKTLALHQQQLQTLCCCSLLYLTGKKKTLYPLSTPGKVTLRGSSTMAQTVRLGSVVTPLGSSNEVVYVPPHLSSSPSPVLAFFGGDVQDYPEVMSAHRDHKHYVAWSLTSTALLLATKFPSHHILVIKPSRMERKTFSCYDNFVLSNSVGAPTHGPNIQAVTYLASLIVEALKVATSTMGSGSERKCPSDNTCQSKNFISQHTSHSCLPTMSKSHQEAKNLEQISLRSTEMEYYNLTLIGFSKGCVVLNQLITEFNTISTLPANDRNLLESFVSKVQHMYWLDGGHAGGMNTWITTPTILKSLAARLINIHVHVSPYQVLDELRPWIGKECKTFYTTLRRVGAKVDYELHFEHLPPSLFQHFQVINEFT